MKILLLGKNGQVGWELQRALAPLGELIALDFDSPGPLGADFSKPESLAATVRAVAPQIIVNAAAHTAVDKAESEPELARAVKPLRSAPGLRTTAPTTFSTAAGRRPGSKTRPPAP
jgi:dTDP-4-dehydrorhamnose reductase